MRARFSIKTTLDRNELQTVLHELSLLPNVKTDSELAKSKLDSLIESLPPNDDTQFFVRETFCFLIFDYSTSIWGIVNQPVENIFTFRLQHENANILFDAAHNQLERLLSTPGSKISVAANGHVSVFERSGSNETFSARYKSQRDVTSLIKSKTQALWSAGVTSALGVSAAALSHPRFLGDLKSYFFNADQVNILYWEQFSGRIATAFFVGAILAIYEVIYYIRTHRQVSAMSFNKSSELDN